MRDEGAFTCSEVDPPIVSGTTIIVVAFIPLFTMTGDPGRIFAPMSLTCGFAWTGAFSMVVTPPTVRSCCAGRRASKTPRSSSACIGATCRCCAGCSRTKGS